MGLLGPRMFSSERFVIDRDGAEDEGVVLSRKIKKLEHGRADRPLITDQCLNDVGIGVARA